MAPGDLVIESVRQISGRIVLRDGTKTLVVPIFALSGFPRS
jgi:hypothetical protein